MSMAFSLRTLAHLLGYPDAALRADLPALAELLAGERALSAGTRAALASLIDGLQRADGLAAEARYVETFDHGRRTALHLFEHVHGDSRDRGPAMIDLRNTYATAGLYLDEGQFPDYLPVVLEFASTQDARTAREFLGEMANILSALHGALAEKRSPYAAVMAAVLELAGEKVQAVSLPPEEALDASWAEPEAFGGCSSAGQQAPNTPQPVRIVPSVRGKSYQNPGAAT